MVPGPELRYPPGYCPRRFERPLISVPGAVLPLVTVRPSPRSCPALSPIPQKLHFVRPDTRANSRRRVPCLRAGVSVAERLNHACRIRKGPLVALFVVCLTVRVAPCCLGTSLTEAWVVWTTPMSAWRIRCAVRALAAVRRAVCGGIRMPRRVTRTRNSTMSALEDYVFNASLSDAERSPFGQGYCPHRRHYRRASSGSSERARSRTALHCLPSQLCRNTSGRATR
jgi:hypothetical protein